MDVFIRGKGKITLSQADFAAQGGEGAVYVRGDTAYKIYADPGKMIPVAKMQELSALTLPNIIRPQDALLDRRNRPVGYTMRRVQNAEPLCRLFTRDFRERRGVAPEQILRLVQSLRTGVQHVHAQGMLIVDLNEMNFLADLALPEALFIDVDSYQTPGFPPTAIMDSIRDRHAANGFNCNTDWFSFGIVTFQLFIGIHPYKGKHPSGADLDARMKRNLSVFDPQVGIPKVCYPLDGIPQAYRDWYKAVFADGKRCPPPSGPVAVVVAAPFAPQPTLSSEKLTIEFLYRFPAEIVAPLFSGPTYAAVTTGGIFYGGAMQTPEGDVKIGITPRQGHVIAARIESGKLRLHDVTANRPLPCGLTAEALMESEGRLIVKQGGGLFEIEFLELPAGIQAAVKPIGNALENATQCFDGVAIQNLLGACHASLFPRPGACHTVRIPELDGYQVVDARCDGGALMVVGAKAGKYDRFILRFDPRFRQYDLRSAPDITPSGLNFVTLASGVCIHLDENEEIELFAARKDAPDIKRLMDASVAGGRLFRNAAQVFLARGDSLYRITMQR